PSLFGDRGDQGDGRRCVLPNLFDGSGGERDGRLGGDGGGFQRLRGRGERDRRSSRFRHLFRRAGSHGDRRRHVLPDLPGGRRDQRDRRRRVLPDLFCDGGGERDGRGGGDGQDGGGRPD